MRQRLLTALLCSAATTIALTGATHAQTAPAGHICRGVVSADALGKAFYYVWVRVNPNDSADVWVATGAQVPPKSIPPTPPAASRHTVTPRVSHFQGDFVGVTLPNPRNEGVMLTVSKFAHVMATPRQRSGLACAP